MIPTVTCCNKEVSLFIIKDPDNAKLVFEGWCPICQQWLWIECIKDIPRPVREVHYEQNQSDL